MAKAQSKVRWFNNTPPPEPGPQIAQGEPSEKKALTDSEANG